MDRELIERLSSAHKALEPQLKTLQSATSALKQAIKAASEEPPDALASKGY
jgi:hypothetical protein